MWNWHGTWKRGFLWGTGVTLAKGSLFSVSHFHCLASILGPFYWKTSLSSVWKTIALCLAHSQSYSEGAVLHPDFPISHNITTDLPPLGTCSVEKFLSSHLVLLFQFVCSVPSCPTSLSSLQKWSKLIQHTEASHMIQWYTSVSAPVMSNFCRWSWQGKSYYQFVLKPDF